MGAPDRGSGENSLGSTWASFGRRFAAAAGAGTALVALLAGVPLWVASLRGALACLGVLAVSRLAALPLPRLQRGATDPATSERPSAPADEAR